MGLKVSPNLFTLANVSKAVAQNILSMYDCISPDTDIVTEIE